MAFVQTVTRTRVCDDASQLFHADMLGWEILQQRKASFGYLASTVSRSHEYKN